MKNQSLLRTWKSSIKTKIGIILVLTISGILGIFGIYQYVDIKSTTTKELDELARMTIVRLAEQLVLPLWELDVRWVKKAVISEMGDKRIYAISVRGEGEISQQMKRNADWGIVDATGDISGDFVVRKRDVLHKGNPIGSVKLYITKKFMRSELKRETIKLFLTVLILSVSLLFFLSLMLRKIVIRPINSMLEVADAIAKGDFSQDIKIRQQDEIGILGIGMNSMKEKIVQRETERDRAETALRESEQRYRGLVQNAVVGIYQVERSGKFRMVNQKFSEILGYSSAEELLSDALNAAELYVLPDTRQRILEKFDSQGLLQGEEVEFIRKDGNRIWVKLYARKTVDKDGVVLFEGLVENISQRKRDEAEMRRLRGLLGNIIDSMPSVLVGVDPEGKVTQWNLEAEKITGVKAHEAKGRMIAHVFPQFAGEMNEIRQTIEHREPRTYEKVRTLIKGETRLQDITVYPLMGSEDQGAVIRIDDVTERTRMEEMMIQTEKMMSLGGLAAGMAHEINNPLAGMIQNAQVALNRMSKDLPANRRVAADCNTTLEAVRAYAEKRGIPTMLEEVRNSGGRAAKIVKNMLNFSRKSESESGLHPLPALLDKTVELASSDYDLKKKYDFRLIEIIRKYDPDLPDVPCVETEIQQVILNLLKNAAQAMAEGGKSGEKSPIPKSQRIILRVRRDNGMARIEVEDNGPGMDGSVRKRIFEPFFTTKKVGVGTGLGLSLSYFIITKNHGGAMTVASTPGKGTKFVIQLPLKATQ